MADLRDILQHLFPFLVLAAYAASGFFYIRLLCNESGRDAAHARRCLRIGLLFHLAFLSVQYLVPYMSTELSAQKVYLDTPFSLSLVSLLLLGIFTVLEQALGISVLGAFVAPLGIVFMLFSGVLFHFSQETKEVVDYTTLLWVHIGSAVSAHVLFVFACGVSGALILQENLLKKKKYTLVQRKLPSLRLLDTLNARLLLFGFVLMSLAVGTGFLFAYNQGLRVFTYDPRLLWSSLTLSIYLVLVIAHYVYGLRGRRAAWLSVAGFSTVVASFFAVNMIGDSFHVF